MIDSRIDQLARTVASKRQLPRRTAVGALLLGAIASSDKDQAAAEKKRRKRRPRACFGSATCAYEGGGHDYDNCNFSDSQVFKNGVGSGGSFRRADLRGANFAGADVSGAKFLNANLNGASFRDADVSGAGMDFACAFDTDFTNVTWAGPFIATAYLCRTILPDGTIANRDCGTAPRCCGK
ncbi:MAG: pentapeptide repeat-containing protein [Thermomicrobiales bacterium]